MTRVRSFAPLAGPGARVLILGSMPGVASLAAEQYYAHPRNAFWPIMGVLYGAGPDKPYAERVRILQQAGVAVWDVLQYCVRPGSLDAAIRAEVPHDFNGFFAAQPALGLVVLNGGKAMRSFRKFVLPALPAGVTVRQAPSTSPAYAAMGRAEKERAWAQILDF